jgi:hypothetical protein
MSDESTSSLSPPIQLNRGSGQVSFLLRDSRCHRRFRSVLSNSIVVHRHWAAARKAMRRTTHTLASIEDGAGELLVGGPLASVATSCGKMEPLPIVRDCGSTLFR